MEKLELKHLAPYLPYELQMITSADGRGAYDRIQKRRLKKIEILTFDNFNLLLFLNRKPILRPLSDITKKIEVNGEKFIPIIEICKYLFPNYTDHEFVGYNEAEKLYEVQAMIAGDFPFFQFAIYVDKENMSYKTAVKLFEWHFDLNNLIPKGLAIDINTIQS